MNGDGGYEGPVRAVSIWLGEVDRRIIAQADAEERQAMQDTSAVTVELAGEAHDVSPLRKRRGEALMAAVRSVIADDRGGAWS